MEKGNTRSVTEDEKKIHRQTLDVYIKQTMSNSMKECERFV